MVVGENHNGVTAHDLAGGGVTWASWHVIHGHYLCPAYALLPIGISPYLILIWINKYIIIYIHLLEDQWINMNQRESGRWWLDCLYLLTLFENRIYGDNSIWDHFFIYIILLIQSTIKIERSLVYLTILRNNSICCCNDYLQSLHIEFVSILPSIVPGLCDNSSSSALCQPSLPFCLSDNSSSSASCQPIWLRCSMYSVETLLIYYDNRVVMSTCQSKKWQRSSGQPW